MAVHIFFATDSRGRRLQSYVRSHRPFPYNWRETFICVPGGTVSSICNAVVQEIKSCPYQKEETKIVILAAGICNFTEKVRHERGCEITYNSTPEKVENIVSEFENVHLLLTHSLNIIPKIATIPPASLSKYQSFSKSKQRLQNSILTP